MVYYATFRIFYYKDLAYSPYKFMKIHDGSLFEVNKIK